MVQHKFQQLFKSYNVALRLDGFRLSIGRVRARGCVYERVTLIRVLTAMAACVHRSVCDRKHLVNASAAPGALMRCF